MFLQRRSTKTKDLPTIDLAWPAFFTRVMIGITFAMAGYWKVFTLTPIEHAQRLFLDQFGNTWIPHALLWALGVTIPFVELLAGALLIIGLFRRPCAIVLGFLLLIVTYGHLLREPLFDIHPYIFTRLILLSPVMILGPAEDVWSLDAWRKGFLSWKREGKVES